MRKPLDDRELVVMECIHNSPDPLGSWSLVELLEGRGYRVSSASIGRTLFRLEQRGYVEGRGNRGRVITEAGVQAIGRARAIHSVDTHRRNLENLITSKVLEDFIMVLRARKAIERETARLAAENITEDGIGNLLSILEEQEIRARRGQSIAEIDIAFHRGIAAASRNTALLALYGILSTMGQQSELFEIVRSRANAPYRPAHRSILDAIRARDPDLAEETMIRHMDTLIEDVTKYWDARRDG
ncbi:MAG TPA: FCD domain-containing protein [Magnetospirillaceae bacterium]|nr:FCD domain-containing protein [Magnetospirillaceae bacterium]